MESPNYVMLQCPQTHTSSIRGIPGMTYSRVCFSSSERPDYGKTGMKINTEMAGVVKLSVLTFKNSTLIYKAATFGSSK